ncbi:MAG: twin-arginine translocation signal domain-containing protein, partial [Pirellulaceae bacterium]
MLTIFDPADREKQFCDGLSRRNFLKIGALGAAGLTLPQLLASEAAAGIRKSTKSVILIYLVGGPPHQDMFDLKPEAPR